MKRKLTRRYRGVAERIADFFSNMSYIGFGAGFFENAIGTSMSTYSCTIAVICLTASLAIEFFLSDDRREE